MRRGSILFLLWVCVFVPGCQKPVDVEAETTAIEKVLTSYIESVEKEDMELYATNLRQDEAMVNFGAFGGPIMGWEALQKVMEGQNDMLSDIQITTLATDSHLAPSGKLAWATTLWSFKAMIEDKLLDLLVRCTWILEKSTDGSWHISTNPCQPDRGSEIPRAY